MTGRDMTKKKQKYVTPGSKKPLLQKGALYIRVSTHWQIDKDSLPVQREDLINYCKFALNLESFEVFEDAGYSAKNTERPAYQQMMARLRAGEFSHLVVTNSSTRRPQWARQCLE
jgi:DNA invertase Pin-like site-specific DNA recombinase